MGLAFSAEFSFPFVKAGRDLVVLGSCEYVEEQSSSRCDLGSLLLSSRRISTQ